MIQSKLLYKNFMIAVGFFDKEYELLENYITFKNRRKDELEENKCSHLQSLLLFRFQKVELHQIKK